MLTAIDHYTREALATESRGSFTAHEVVGVLNRLPRSHPKLSVIDVDNGPEFASRALDEWPSRKDPGLDFSRHGKPTDNAHIESFNAQLRARVGIALRRQENMAPGRIDHKAVRPTHRPGHTDAQGVH